MALLGLHHRQSYRYYLAFCICVAALAGYCMGRCVHKVKTSAVRHQPGCPDYPDWPAAPSLARLTCQLPSQCRAVMLLKIDFLSSCSYLACGPSTCLPHAPTHSRLLSFASSIASIQLPDCLNQPPELPHGLIVHPWLHSLHAPLHLPLHSLTVLPSASRT